MVNIPLGLAGGEISKPTQYFQSNENRFIQYIRSAEFLYREMLNYVSLNIYHQNIIRIT